MKAPHIIPEAKRRALYRQVASRPLSLSEKDLVSIVQNGRVDPRLAEVVTEHIRDFWWKYDAKELNKKLRGEVWAASIKPMLNQIVEFCSADVETESKFKAWARQVVIGVPDSPPQLYFYLPLPPRSASQDREMLECIPSFSRAGYAAKDLLFNKGNAKSIAPVGKGPDTKMNSADLLKVNLAHQINTRLKDLTLKKIETSFRIDRTTASKIRTGKIEGMSANRLATLERRTRP